MEKKFFAVLVFVFLFCVWPWWANAAELTAADDIIKKQKELYRFGLHNEKEWDKVLIKDKTGTLNKKSVVWTLFNERGNDRQLVKMLEPPNEKGVTILINRNFLSADEQWVFIPQLRRVRRQVLSPKDNISGTDFSIEDLKQLTGLEDGTHFYKILGENEKIWIIEAIPTQKNGGPYSKRVIWIRKDNYFLIHCDYYGKNGGLLKRQKNLDIVEVQPGLWRMGKIWTKNFQTGREITRTITERKFNQPLDKDFFTLPNLEREGGKE